MIDVPTLTRNMRDCIQQYPTTVRWNGNTYQVWLNAVADVVHTLDAGTRDDMSIQIIAARDDWVSGLPKSMDDIEVLQSDNVTWITFQVRDVPDYYDVAPVLTFNLQSVNKGID